MGLRINATLALNLPDDPHQIAATLGEVATAWSAFTTALGQHKAEVEFSICETRTPTVRRKQRAKKAAAVAAPVDTAEAA